MLVIHICLIMFMTRGAVEQCIIGRDGMAFDAIIPLFAVWSRIYREVQSIMIPISRCPGVEAVAIFAIGRELRRCVVRVASGIVILLMTAGTNGWCSGINCFVTGDAGQSLVCSQERKGRIVVVERSWFPGDGSMTGLAFCRKTRGIMIGIAGRGIFITVAGKT